MHLKCVIQSIGFLKKRVSRLMGLEAAIEEHMDFIEKLESIGSFFIRESFIPWR